MAAYNRCILIGNLTRDPEVKYLPSGTAVVDLGLAVNHRVKRNEEWVDEVDFIDITIFGRQAEVAGEYCTKGSPLMVEGRLKLEQWEQDGNKRSKLKVIGENIQLLSQKGGGGEQEENTAATKSKATKPAKTATKAAKPAETQVENEIPF